MMIQILVADDGADLVIRSVDPRRSCHEHVGVGEGVGVTVQFTDTNRRHTNACRSMSDISAGDDIMHGINRVLLP
jgi:hypothetical protein